MIINQIIRLKI